MNSPCSACRVTRSCRVLQNNHWGTFCESVWRASSTGGSRKEATVRILQCNYSSTGPVGIEAYCPLLYGLTVLLFRWYYGYTGCTQQAPCQLVYTPGSMIDTRCRLLKRTPSAASQKTEQPMPGPVLANLRGSHARHLWKVRDLLQVYS